MHPTTKAGKMVATTGVTEPGRKPNRRGSRVTMTGTLYRIAGSIGFEGVRTPEWTSCSLTYFLRVLCMRKGLWIAEATLDGLKMAMKISVGCCLTKFELRGSVEKIGTYRSRPRCPERELCEARPRIIVQLEHQPVFEWAVGASWRCASIYRVAQTFLEDSGWGCRCKVQFHAMLRWP